MGDGGVSGIGGDASGPDTAHYGRSLHNLSRFLNPIVLTTAIFKSTLLIKLSVINYLYRKSLLALILIKCKDKEPIFIFPFYFFL